VSSDFVVGAGDGYLCTFCRCKVGGCGGLVRPHVVWFGECLESSILEEVDQELKNCDLCMLVGRFSISTHSNFHTQHTHAHTRACAHTHTAYTRTVHTHTSRTHTRTHSTHTHAQHTCIYHYILL